MSDPDDSRDEPATDVPDGAPGDDAADGGTTGATLLDEEAATDEESGGPGDDAAAGDSTTATGH